MELLIRTASASDAKALADIYAPYVLETAITFEYEAPTTPVFAGRIEKTMERYPWLVAERGGELVGYAYLSAFHTRAAYDWAAETAIYLRMDQKRQGVGTVLYQTLEACARAQRILNLNACIAWPDREDEHLTRDSEKFHQRLGYRLVGEFRQCGYKFDRWYNMIWMEKHLGAHGVNPAPVLAFDEVRGGLGL